MKKGPPYKIENGIAGQKPPAYVRHIGIGKISLGGNFKSLGLTPEISYKDDGKKYEDNLDLRALMIKLNDMGVAFSYDYKANMSPNCLMEILQDKDLLKKEYREIAWRGKDNWYIRFHEII